MDGDGKEGARQLPYPRLGEVLQILAGKEQGGFLFSYSFKRVADVGDDGGIGQPQVQLVNGCHGIAQRQKLIRHIGQQTEQQGVPQILRHVIQSLDTENKEFGTVNIGMPIKEPGVRATAHGMEPQQQIPQHFPRIKTGGVIVVIGFLDRIVEVGEDGVILRPRRREVRAVGDVPFFIQALHHQLQRVDVGRIEALVDAEHIPQEGDVLGEQRPPESVRRVRVFRPAAIVPAAGLQQVDAVLPTEVVQKAAAQGAALVLHLMLGVQRDHAFARLPHIAEQELQKITLALPSVAEDEGAGVGLVRSPAVEVHDDVGAEAVPANEEASGIGFAGIVHGVQIGNAPGRQDTLRKIGKLAATRGVGGEKAFPLAQEQRIGAHAGANQLGGYRVPRRAQLFRIRGGNIQVNAAVDERLLFLTLLCQQLRHIP